MGVSSFVWRGVLAFDRVGSRIPQLIQTWLLDFLFAMSTAFFIGKVIDIRGAFDVPGTGGSIPAVFWGALVVALVSGFFFVRGLVRPRITQGSWAPMVPLPLGEVDVLVANRRAGVSYHYLTSHPSYSLLLLLGAPLPLAFWYFSRNEGDSTFYWRITGIVGLAAIAVLALARVLAWYVFRFGRAALDATVSTTGLSSARIRWEVAWKPVVMLVVVCYAVVCIPLGIMNWMQHRRVAALPIVTVADAKGHAEQYVRVQGPMASEPVYWAPNGTGRGGNNFAGAGVLIDLPDGGQALLLAESMTVSDFAAAVRAARESGVLSTQGRVIDGVTDVQHEYYGLDDAAFPDPPERGRVMVLLSTP